MPEKRNGTGRSLRWRLSRTKLARTLRAIRRIPENARAVIDTGLFDAEWYRFKYQSVLSASIDPVWHYVSLGAHLDPNPLFDTRWYIARRPDTAPPATIPLLHYLRYGAEEGMDPNPGFNGWAYCRRYPDVGQSGMTPLEHYLRIGISEGRNPRLSPSWPRGPGAQHVRCRVSPDSRSPTGDNPAKTPAQQRRVCIFSHFDASGRILPYVQRYLSALRACGFEVYLVSTAQALDPADKSGVEAMGVAVHLRQNIGLDFGSWQWALRHVISTADVDWLLLANDSVFGPLFPIDELIESGISARSDFWGMTDSHQSAWHVQSYFICLSGDVVRSAAFRMVFDQDFNSQPKRWIIDNGEIFLSQALLSAGYRGHAMCALERIDQRRPPVASNPSHFEWDLLIARFGCPFVKRELLARNPAGIEGVENWKSFLERYTRYDTDLIVEGLRGLPGPK